MVRTPLSLPRAQVQSLVEELKSHKLCGAARKKNCEIIAKICISGLGEKTVDGVRWFSLWGELASSFARQKC